MSKNKNKKPLNSLIEINNNILPFFSNPIVLKRINDQKKNKDLNSLNPQKKLIYKIIKLNENLVKFTTSIKNYNLNLDLFFLSNGPKRVGSVGTVGSVGIEGMDNSKTSYPSHPGLPVMEDGKWKMRVQNHIQLIKEEVSGNPTSLQSEGEGLIINKIEDRGFNHQNKLNMNAGNKSEFILFTRNNLYYSIKYRLSNIKYKIEKFIPVFNFYSLLNNINLFAPKRLLKPQDFMRFTYRLIQLNNSFKFKNDSSSTTLLQNASLTETLNVNVYPSSTPSTLNLSYATPPFPSLRDSLRDPNSLGDRRSDYAGPAAVKKEKAMLHRRRGTSYAPNGPYPLGSGENTLTMPSVLPSLTSTSLYPSIKDGKGNLGKFKVGVDHSLTQENTRKKVLITINKFKDQYSNPIIRLHISDNARSIKYLLLKLDNLLNEIENLINIKNNLIKIIKIKNIKNLSKLDRNELELVKSNGSPSSFPILTQPSQNIKEKDELDRSLIEHQISEVQYKENLYHNAEVVRPSNQSVQNLRLEIKRINSNNDNIETYPLLVEAGMVKENKIKIEKNINSMLPMIKTKPVVGSDAPTDSSPSLPDILNENSNPVDLLYFNNNLNKPVINQYLKSMSTYNMITNGTILYYSNIIGFNFKNRIRAYLPFIKSISPISKSHTATLNNHTLHSSLGNGQSAFIKNGERLTSPYSFRSIRKVVGSLDKGKFSIFGRGIENNKLINNIYKFLYLSFKSMYCLISKPVFIVKSNKIIIQLFYFLLIPKIFKHIKSKTKYKPIKKKGKRIYLSFIEKRKKQALAALFESRLTEKEDAIKKKYFMQYSLNSELNNRSNTAIMNLDAKSAPLLNLNYKNEFVEARKAEEKISDVKFDKSGKVKLDSIEYKLEKIPQLLIRRRSRRRSQRLSISSSILFNGTSTKLKNKNLKSKNNKIKWRSYKLFFKRFEFNNIIKDLHILRIPTYWTHFALPNLNNLRVKNYETGQWQYSQLSGGSELKQRQYLRSNNRKFINPKRNIKLFKYLALTYLNIFKFKDRRNILNRLKLNISSGYAKKKLIKDKSYLLSYKYNDSALSSEANAAYARGGIKRNNRRNKINSYNQVNWYLFKKLFWSIRLSKKIIPNAKILQKLGIPQWSWPYSGIKKKGYNIYNMPKDNKLSRPSNISISLKGVSTGLATDSTQTTLSYSWPFSLLMSPTFLKLNKEVNRPTENLNSRIPVSTASNTDTATQIQQGVLYTKEGGLSASHPSVRTLRSEVRATQGWLERIPVIKKQNRYKIRELYTKRYHLMKLANINLVKVYPLKFEKLCEVLNSLFNKPVELDLIRLHYPYNDSNILVRLLAFMINKMKLRRITRRLFNKAVVKSIKKINNKDQVNIIPAFLSGMTIKVAGRLMKYKVIPRKTVKIVRRGSSSIGKINYSDISRYTNKNKRGSFTITIKSGQNFFN